MDVPEIDVATFADLQAQGATVLDVRNPDEYDEGHLPGAVLVPLGDLGERVDDVPDTNGGPLYVVCSMGGRSRRAAQFLRAQGIDAINLAGGMIAWTDEGHPVVTGSEPG